MERNNKYLKGVRDNLKSSPINQRTTEPVVFPKRNIPLEKTHMLNKSNFQNDSTPKDKTYYNNRKTYTSPSTSVKSSTISSSSASNNNTSPNRARAYSTNTPNKMPLRTTYSTHTSYKMTSNSTHQKQNSPHSSTSTAKTTTATTSSTRKFTSASSSKNTPKVDNNDNNRGNDVRDRYRKATSYRVYDNNDDLNGINFGSKFETEESVILPRNDISSVDFVDEAESNLDILLKTDFNKFINNSYEEGEKGNQKKKENQKEPDSDTLSRIINSFNKNFGKEEDQGQDNPDVTITKDNVKSNTATKSIDKPDNNNKANEITDKPGQKVNNKILTESLILSNQSNSYPLFKDSEFESTHTNGTSNTNGTSINTFGVNKKKSNLKITTKGLANNNPNQAKDNNSKKDVKDGEVTSPNYYMLLFGDKKNVPKPDKNEGYRGQMILTDISFNSSFNNNKPIFVMMKKMKEKVLLPLQILLLKVYLTQT